MTTPIEELRTLIPVLIEKEKNGLIRGNSGEKAKSLCRWVDSGRTLTEKQEKLVGTLLRRAKIRHRNLKIDTVKADVDAVTKRVLEQIGEQKADTDAIAKIVESIVWPKLEAKLANEKPRKVEVTVKKGTVKKTLKGPTHAKFEWLLKAATSRLSNGYVPGIFLQGEASSGKTTGARQLADALGLKWHFNGAISFPHEMLGFIDGAGKYHTTPFREAYEKGGVYTFDEVDRSDPVALLAVNPHLANGIATFPDKQVKRHPDCIIICTANTWGLGADANYSGATKLDAAFLSRFPIRINWDIDPLLEAAIITNTEWLARVRLARGRARSAGLKVLIDVRAAEAGQALIEVGYSLDEAAEQTYLANLKPDQRSQIEG